MIISHVWQLEQAMKHLAISTSQNNELIDKLISIHNLHNTSFAHRHLLKYFNQCSMIDSTYYPETAHTVYLINAPSLFTGMYNTLIKPFLDPVTASKLQLYSHKDWQSKLVTDLGEDCIPSIYGGGCTCSNIVHDNNIIQRPNNCFPPIIPMTEQQTLEYTTNTSTSWW